jgi:YrbI family 3-deoxy-D-manno-octulosonate 8-phosphate phosphatase
VGIPRKNVTNLCGKPLIAWNIEAALASNHVEGVYVTTDNSEIASISKLYGASVIERPSKLAGDTASSEGALLHALNNLDSQALLPDYLIFMQCTSPLTTTEDIDRAFTTLIEQEADSCFTASRFHHFLWRRNDNSSTSGINHDKSFRPMRQECEHQFAENGAIYVMKVDGFRRAKHRFFGKTVISLMPPERCAEIDEPIDFKIAELLLREQLKKRRCSMLPDKVLGVAFDFDGVMTDNRVWTDQAGNETVACDRSDGWGLNQLKKTDLKLVVLSTEMNPVVAARCKKLGIDCLQGLGANKLEAFSKWCSDNNLNSSTVIFVGNDANDVECLNFAACGIVTADAYPEARSAANIILEKPGGGGAVREVCDMIDTPN